MAGANRRKSMSWEKCRGGKVIAGTFDMGAHDFVAKIFLDKLEIKWKVFDGVFGRAIKSGAALTSNDAKFKVESFIASHLRKLADRICPAS
jgi:hypothetical protein